MRAHDKAFVFGRLFALCGMLVLGACGAKTELEVRPCERDGGACCEPVEERCDGLDDDCDGVPDDGLSCFFLDGEPIAAQDTSRCGADWYGYDAPDSQSANPMPDIRVPDGVVVAFQTGPSCGGANLAVITDIPRDEAGGNLLARWTMTPGDAAGVLVSDEPHECVHDPRSGDGSCDWTWVACCTDGVLLGTFTRDACVTLTLTDPVGVAPPVVLDGARAIERAYGVPMELCVRIRPAAP